jgi:hypothetical protein
MKKRAAVMVVGELRFADVFLPMWRRKLDALFDTRWFLHTWSPTDEIVSKVKSTRAIHETVFRDFPCTSFRVDEPVQGKGLDLTRERSRLDFVNVFQPSALSPIVRDYWHPSLYPIYCNATPVRGYSQFTSYKRAFDLCRDAELEFDCFVKIRSDCFPDSVPDAFFAPTAGVRVPYQVGISVSDIVAFGDFRHAAAYFSTVDSLAEFTRRFGVYQAEPLLYWHLVRHQVPIEVERSGEIELVRQLDVVEGRTVAYKENLRRVIAKWEYGEDRSIAGWQKAGEVYARNI